MVINSGAGLASARLQKLQILLVEDHLGCATSMATWLHLVGHEAVICSNGHDALGHVRTHDPDVVLIDIGLPGMNGYEVARAIDEHRQGERPLLIATTSHGQESDRRRSAAAGFDLHLLKPVDLDALELTLNQFLREMLAAASN